MSISQVEKFNLASSKISLPAFNKFAGIDRGEWVRVRYTFTMSGIHHFQVEDRNGYEGLILPQGDLDCFTTV